MNHIFSPLSVFIFIGLMFGSIFEVQGQKQQKLAYAVLAGGNVEPNEVQTSASGYMEIYLKSDTLIVEGEARNLSDVYQTAAIFYGNEGEIGNMLFRLKGRVNEAQTTVTFSPEKNRFGLTENLRNALRKNMLYISVSTAEHPHGEIRGQIKFIG